MRQFELALQFAAHNVPNFPVRFYYEDGKWKKKPHIKQWQHRASVDPQQIVEWWQQWPDAWPGIALGQYGRVVVDCDRHGGPDGVVAFAKLGPMPSHPIVATPSRGEHRYFLQPDPPITSNDAMAEDGIDILGSSHFVVGYDLASLLAVPAPPLPEVFRAGARSKPVCRIETPTVCGVVSRNSREGRYAWAALQNAFQKFATWPREQRGRNKLLNKLAFKMGGLVANGWIDEALVIRVLMLGAADCGLLRDDGEERCLATIRSGLSAGMQLPYPQLEPRYV